MFCVCWEGVLAIQILPKSIPELKGLNSCAHSLFIEFVIVDAIANFKWIKTTAFVLQLFQIRSCTINTVSSVSWLWKKTARKDKILHNLIELLLFQCFNLQKYISFLLNLLSARHIVLPCVTPHKANTGSFRRTIFHVNYLCPQLMGPHPVGVRLYRDTTPRSCQGHLKVKHGKIFNWIFFYSFLLQRSARQGCSWYILAEEPYNTHPKWLLCGLEG